MKSILKITILVGVIIFLTGNYLNAQNAKKNTIQFNRLIDKVEWLEEYKSKWMKQKVLFEDISREFCYLNSAHNKIASKFLKIAINTHFIETNIKHRFLVKNAFCFNSEQIKKIRSILNVELSSSDFYYHDLIIKFNLTSQIPLLKEHLTDSLFISLKRNIQSGEMEDCNRLQLRDIATLINLNLFTDEDAFLENINSLYRYSRDRKNLIFFIMKFLIIV